MHKLLTFIFNFSTLLSLLIFQPNCLFLLLFLFYIPPIFFHSKFQIFYKLPQSPPFLPNRQTLLNNRVLKSCPMNQYPPPTRLKEIDGQNFCCQFFLSANCLNFPPPYPTLFVDMQLNNRQDPLLKQPSCRFLF